MGGRSQIQTICGKVWILKVCTTQSSYNIDYKPSNEIPCSQNRVWVLV